MSAFQKWITERVPCDVGRAELARFMAAVSDGGDDQPRKILHLVGPPASGKSTFIRLADEMIDRRFENCSLSYLSNPFGLEAIMRADCLVFEGLEPKALRREGGIIIDLMKGVPFKVHRTGHAEIKAASFRGGIVIVSNGDMKVPPWMGRFINEVFFEPIDGTFGLGFPVELFRDRAGFQAWMEGGAV